MAKKQKQEALDGHKEDIQSSYTDSELQERGLLPTLFYRCPGDHSRPGGTYSYLPIRSIEQAKAAIADGWRETLLEAIEEYDGEVK